MPLKTVDATVSNFNQVFENFKSEAPKNQINLLLFLADKDPSTSLSWCPGSLSSLSLFLPYFSQNCHLDNSHINMFNSDKTHLGFFHFKNLLCTMHSP